MLTLLFILGVFTGILVIVFWSKNYPEYALVFDRDYTRLIRVGGVKKENYIAEVEKFSGSLRDANAPISKEMARIASSYSMEPRSLNTFRHKLLTDRFELSSSTLVIDFDERRFRTANKQLRTLELQRQERVTQENIDNVKRDISSEE